MVTEERIIEVTVISAMDLKKVKKFGREQKCYAVAYIYPKQKLATAVDKQGGVQPTWNSTLLLSCPESHLHPPFSLSYAITVDIYSHSTFRGPKFVGSTTLPLRELTPAADANPKDPEQQRPLMAAFQVRRPSGKIKGILHLSVRLGAKRTVDQSTFHVPSHYFNNFNSNYVTGASDSHYQPSSTGFAEGKVVTGYPAVGPAGGYSVPTEPFSPLGPLPGGQAIPQRSSSSTTSRRPAYQKTRWGRVGRSKRRHNVSIGILILAGTVLAIIFF